MTCMALVIPRLLVLQGRGDEEPVLRAMSGPDCVISYQYPGYSLAQAAQQTLCWLSNI